MDGAKKFASLFETGQYGKLYITSGSHARGATFHIQVLPDGESAKPNGSQNLCLNSNAVEVYGIISGQLGWRESYGWLHHGAWEEDFRKLVLLTQIKLENERKQFKIDTDKRKQREQDRENKLLSAY